MGDVLTSNRLPPTTRFVSPTGAPLRLMFMGDSNTFGSDATTTGMNGSWPTSCVQYLRTLRSDFEVIGSLLATAENAAMSSLPFNEGHAGFTIAGLASGYAGFCATLGVGAPDVLVGDMAGTNDISTGRTLAQMQADTQTLLNAVLAVNPATKILLMPPPPFAAGTLVGANLATWNAQQAAFATWVRTVFAPANAPSVVYCAASQSIGNGDIQSDGIHFNQGGMGAVGVGVAQQLHGLMGPPTKDVLPRVFNTRQPWYSVFVGGDGLTDDIVLVAHAGFNPGAGSFTLAFDYCPTTFANFGGLSVIRYGVSGTNNYYEIFVASNPATNGGLSFSVYWMAAVQTLAAGGGMSFGASPGATPNGWHRIVLMVDAVTLTIGLYINGQLAGIKQGLSAWTSTQQNLFIGASLITNGAPGYYGRVYAAQAIPGRPGSMAALLAVEEDYYLNRSLCPGQGSASFTLNNILTDDVYAPGAPNPSMVLQGNAAFVPGYPSGTPLRPWEVQPALPPYPPPQVANAITTPTTGTITLTYAQAQNAVIPISMTLTGDVTIVIPVPGEYHFDISGVTFSAHNLFFKYGSTSSPAITALSTSADLAIVVAGAKGPNTIACNF